VTVAGSAKLHAHRAARSDSMKAVGRAGLAAHGVIWLLLGILALVMAFSGRKQETDQRGAMQELAQQSGGWILLLVITIGLAAYALWRLVDAVVNSETKERVADVVRAVIYGGFAASGVQILVEGHTKSQKKNQESWTSTIMQHTGGRWLIGIVGVVIVGIGGYLAYEGLTKKFEEDLDRPPRWVIALGMIGSAARGVVVALAGVLTVSAAVAYDPKKASGVDGALRTVRDAPAGTVLLVLVALGLVMFGIYGCCEAKYRRL
jgi:uncharacterized membrane protein YfcA